MYLTIAQTIISWGFYLLFFCVPLIFTSINSELFEFNKMVLTYGLTIIIVGAWICKMILTGKLIYRRTLLEIPLLLYFTSHVLSTIFSIDTRTSIFGYYSRFHEGLLATISYILLYFAAVSNLNKDNVKNIFYASFAAGIIVAVWGTFEHYGHSLSCLMVTGSFDVGCWVQDVKNRVYATLGQPNWMAAYLDVLILTSFAFIRKRENVMLNLFQHLVPVLFFAALLFTKSRSGVLGLIAGLAVFFVILFWKNKKRILDPARITVVGLFLLFGIIFGLPLPKIEGKSLENYYESKGQKAQNIEPKKQDTGYIDIGISTSSDIRKVVWDGAIKVWQRYPVFGSGVETFAYSYYKDRPAAHNMLSEWDFLYNKAHNEVLNLLATTGTVGIIAYFLVIVAFIRWFLLTPNRYPLTAMLGAYVSILVTNFFGFSVVIIGLYFFLIPAFCYINNEN